MGSQNVQLRIRDPGLKDSGISPVNVVAWIILCAGAALAVCVLVIPLPHNPWLSIDLATVAAGLILPTLAYAFKPGSRTKTILLIGNEPALIIIASMLTAGRNFNSFWRRPPGIGFNILSVGSVEEALRRARTINCDIAVVSQLPEKRIQGSLLDARRNSIRLVTADHTLEMLTGRVAAHASFEDVYQRTLSSRSGLRDLAGVLKRAIDLTLLLGLFPVVILPCIIATIALRLTGVARPIVSQPRVGRDGRAYDMLMFQTVNRPRETRSWTIPYSDYLRPRIQFLLSQSHFNLAPSLVNILFGQMSFVGPKPMAREELDANAEWLNGFARRLRCRPGLVSLARVRFRYSGSPRDVRLAFEYDLFYVKYWTPGLDVRILLRAALIVLRDWVATLGVLCRYIVQRWLVPVARSLTVRGRPANYASVAMPKTLGGGDAINFKPALLVGAGSGGRQLVPMLRTNPDLGLWPVAFVDDDVAKVGTRVSGLPVLGTTSSILAIVERESVETIVISMPSASEVDLKRVADIARGTKAEVLTMPPIATILRGTPVAALRHVPTTDFLGRPVVTPDVELCRAFLHGQRVLVTGAAGSIGQEVARQVTQGSPAIVYGMDINESDLFDLQQDILTTRGAAPFEPVVASVTSPERIAQIIAELKPDIVFHAAAYKHVPMMEEYPTEAVTVNTIGTWQVARAAAAAGVQRFVLVSTDKAVRPSSVMGATKRLAEMVVQAVGRETGMSACAVRFGNVLGSRGSVIPLFQKQIANGGPVTVTDSRMMRYFMTIPEAAGLIIQAGALGDNHVIYMLDMGDEVSIVSLADRMIRLHGKQPGKDIEIRFTGLRPGEKLRESLSLDFETACPTSHPKIRVLSSGEWPGRQRLGSAELIDRVRELITTERKEEIRADVMALLRELDGSDGDQFEYSA